MSNYVNIKPTPIAEITKEQFFAYERVRTEGRVNMFDITMLCFLTDLKPEDIKAIQQNFKALRQKFK